MLKIDLRPGESIRVGDAVITLEEKPGQIARLSVQADKSVPISKIGQATGISKMIAENGITSKV